MAGKLVCLRRAVIDFQHRQKEAVSVDMRDRMTEVLRDLRATEGENVTLTAEEEDDVHRSVRRYERAVFGRVEDDRAHFRRMLGFDQLWDRWITRDSPEVARVRRELDLHIDVDDYVWSLQQVRWSQ